MIRISSLLGTDFQKKVWAYTLTIPVGETRTYQQVAIAIGVPGAARAVGSALRKNPCLIDIPCHRVIRSDGGMGGYAGGGVERKKELLKSEVRDQRSER